MMCYKDMTFCGFKQCVKFGSCKRSFTDKAKADADKWWGDKDAPVCMYMDKPTCFTVCEERKQ
jgi:hypothetical protein